MQRQHLEFAVALHRELADAGGGVAWSPYSVASALGLAAAGARGATRDELVRALGGDLDALAKALATAARIDDAEAGVANSLWARQGVPFHQAYLETVRRWPGGTVEAADFAHDPDGARRKINGSVERDTRGLIRELLVEGAINTETAAVIVNALYLKVAWQTPFVEGETRPAPFHAPSGTHDVPTMRQTERFRYAAGDGWRMVSLPTASRDVVVDLLLADDDGAGLAAGTVHRLWDAAKPTRVSLAVPRFRIEAGYPLNGPLAGLGVRDAFARGRADFSGIADAEMFIETAVHKAVLTVDEQGFEGAAATALAFRLTSIDMSRPVTFHADRPFFVLVRHAATGAVYFLAHVIEP
jgi:serine protease inhibitor